MATGVENRPTCFICGTRGVPRYRALKDLYLHVPGEWNLVRCPADGLWWLDPRPREEEFAKLYTNYHTHATDTPTGVTSPLTATWRWCRKGIWAATLGYSTGQEHYGQLVVGLILGIVRPLRDKAAGDIMWLRGKTRGRLLDVGSGGGQFLRRMKDAGWAVLGVEPDPTAVEVARGLGVEVLSGTLDQLPSGQHRFDAITLNHVIEHVPDPLATLRHCWGLLAPGGRLVVTTPNVHSLGHRVFRRSWRGLEPPRHLQIFSQQSLRRTAERAGITRHRLRVTARSAPYIFDSSAALAAGGIGMESGGASSPGSLLFLLLESILMPWLGEELLFIAQKPRQPTK